MTVFAIIDPTGRWFGGDIVDEAGRHLDGDGWVNDPARAWEFDTRAEAETARPDGASVVERFYDDEDE